MNHEIPDPATAKRSRWSPSAPKARKKTNFAIAKFTIIAEFVIPLPYAPVKSQERKGLEFRITNFDKFSNSQNSTSLRSYRMQERKGLEFLSRISWILWICFLCPLRGRSELIVAREARNSLKLWILGIHKIMNSRPSRASRVKWIHKRAEGAQGSVFGWPIKITSYFYKSKASRDFVSTCLLPLTPSVYAIYGVDKICAGFWPYWNFKNAILYWNF